MSGKYSDLSEKSKKFIAIGGVTLFLIITVVVFYFVGRPMVKFAAEPDKFRGWIDSFGAYGYLVFLGMMVLQVFVAIIPGEPLEIVAGYAFGMIEGTLLCMAGAFIGSMLVFMFVRKFGVKAVEIFFPMEKINSIKFLHNAKKRDTLIFIIFLLPGTPKDLLCYFVGLTDIKLSTWMIITSVARIPSIVTSTIGGNALGVKNYVFAIIMLGVTLAISAVGLLIYKAITKRNQRREGMAKK